MSNITFGSEVSWPLTKDEQAAVDLQNSIDQVYKGDTSNGVKFAEELDGYDSRN